MKKYFLYGLLVWYLVMCGYGTAAESDITLNDNTTNSGFSIKEETTDSTIARFRGDGNVGIATTSPTEKLEINGNIKISGTGNGIKFPDGTNQTTAATGGGGSGDGHSLDAQDGNPIDAIFVDNSGYVGIGITDPGQKLTVAGTIESTSGGFKFPDGTTQNTSASGGGIPSGAVMFFNLSACPEGWSELTIARGRYLVGKPDGGVLMTTVGTALADQENRAVGRHDHAVTDPGHSHQKSATQPAANTNYTGRNQLVTSSSGQNIETFMLGPDSAGIIVDYAGTLDSTNAPYIQFLACQKN